MWEEKGLWESEQWVATLTPLTPSILQQSKKRKSDFIPYRDSVLTWLLKENLGEGFLSLSLSLPTLPPVLLTPVDVSDQTHCCPWDLKSSSCPLTPRLSPGHPLDSVFMPRSVSSCHTLPAKPRASLTWGSL